MKDEEEERRDIDEYDGLYTVTRSGRVYRERIPIVDRNGNAIQFPYGEMAQRLNKGGYAQVWICKDGKQTGHYVHRLVAKAFHPNPDDLEQVDHLNGIRDDNRAENLEWVTREENIRRSTASGRRKGSKGTVGSEHPRAKLDEATVREARTRKARAQASAREMAREYGVSASTMARALDGTTWAHVDPPDDSR